MGLSAAAIAAWASVAVSAGSAVASNVRQNRAKTPVTKTAIKAPSSAIEDTTKEEDISLGSERASKKGRSRGRRQLMSPQST